jgi:hypothetical protein
LKSSINRTSNVWVPLEFREQYNIILRDAHEMFYGSKKRSKGTTKISAIYLPIGHFIEKFPKLYHPDNGWTEDPTYIHADQEYIENNIIIGYDDKSKTGVHIRFKLRNPIHNIKQYKDTRMIERGTVCRSKDKKKLKLIAEKLNVQLKDRTSVEELCMLIRSKLIRLELKERIKKSKLKWFYFHYENGAAY